MEEKLKKNSLYGFKKLLVLNSVYGMFNSFRILKNGEQEYLDPDFKTMKNSEKGVK